MTIDPEAISPASDQGSRAGRNFPKWLICTTGGIGVLFLVGLLKVFLLVIGMVFLLTFIWSQSKKAQSY